MTEEKQNTLLFSQLFITLVRAAIRNTSIEHLKLTHLQLLVLMTVYSNAGITMSALADAVGISNAQLSRTIGKLEEVQLVRRQHNEHNRRIVNVYGTATGTAVAEKQIRYFQDHVSKQLDSLSPAEQRELNANFASLMKLLSKAGIIREDAQLGSFEQDPNASAASQPN